ncbi:hypothetical protein Nepgr_004092 [Nepenthes gracilis]|uniref:Uncharacterized protein n=1 Tax=Nepenthes gracilis TaxID=150966 RepID=A0AAD3S0T5_NEPGR|nr:hypothetical protein Nepgr_004092 [Nepenthes gracilis]
MARVLPSMPKWLTPRAAVVTTLVELTKVNGTIDSASADKTKVDMTFSDPQSLQFLHQSDPQQQKEMRDIG